jgi:hypothetical protein
VADAADQREADIGDRGEVVERLVADRAEPEGEQDAAERCDRGGERERVQLGDDDVDAERRPFDTTITVSAAIATTKMP